MMRGDKIVAADVIDFKTDRIRLTKQETDVEKKVGFYRPQLVAYRSRYVEDATFGRITDFRETVVCRTRPGKERRLTGQHHLSKTVQRHCAVTSFSRQAEGGGARTTRRFRLTGQRPTHDNQTGGERPRWHLSRFARQRDGG